MSFCGECGAATTHDTKFCPSCGAPQAGKAVDPPPAEPIPASAAVPAPVAAPAQPGSSSKLPLRLAAVLGAVAVVGVLIAVVSGIGGESGGAGSAEEAVRELQAAIEQEDAAAALAIVHPDEKRAAGQVYDAVLEAGRSSKSLDSSGRLAGADVKVKDVTFEGSELGPGVHRVTVTGGTIAATIRGSAVKSVFRPADDLSTEQSIASANLAGGAGVPIMVREKDGKWFVSPIMTALEILVGEEALPAGDFSDPGEPAEGPKTTTAQELASALAGAATERNVAAVLDLISPREAAAVRPYTGTLQQLVARIGDSAEFNVSRVDAEEKSTGSGLVRLDLRGLAGSGTVNGGTANISVNGLCGTAEIFGDTSQSCDTQNFKPLFGVDRGFIMAEKSGDNLRVAPVATVMEYLKALTKELKPSGIARVGGAIGNVKSSGGLGAKEVTGRLNDAGLAVRIITSPGPDALVAVRSDRNVLMVGPDGGAIEALSCANGTSVFQLGKAGTFKAVIAANGLNALSYKVSAAIVKTTDAELPSTVSGTLPPSGVQVLSVEQPTGSVYNFQSESPVNSASIPKGESYCYSSSAESVFGSQPVFNNDESSLLENTSGEYSPSSTVYSASSYLVITGEPGTRWTGELTAEEAYGE